MRMVIKFFLIACVMGLSVLGAQASSCSPYEGSYIAKFNRPVVGDNDKLYSYVSLYVDSNGKLTSIAVGKETILTAQNAIKLNNGKLAAKVGNVRLSITFTIKGQVIGEARSSHGVYKFIGGTKKGLGTAAYHRFDRAIEKEMGYNQNEWQQHP